MRTLLCSKIRSYSQSGHDPLTSLNRLFENVKRLQRGEINQRQYDQTAREIVIASPSIAGAWEPIRQQVDEFKQQIDKIKQDLDAYIRELDEIGRQIKRSEK